ncbi:putative aminohydrolase SsnA [Paramaledivibacter caminithermalis]|uniref:Putative selenium metabolism protein SsnA n=1 Tax=Paramaledivibacter caminithermalis (strain DSM 15212 / CIP 107654 / DViRD3) TaxID=1121301 RepID=A0A1M6K890_PARC5|nr:putative aminohydrolase SsnA [Paramaledivibacter caminithermalis]SHJ55192.1 putative selenium metabolism protein SsnA [Paramaledivibacter caminithermalis DSM 15212]
MIIGNGRIITNDSNNAFIENGAVLIKDNIIEDIGYFEALKKTFPKEEIIDVKGKVIMPGMICTHSHIYSAYARGMDVSKPQRNFCEILKNLWWNLDKKLTLEDVKLNALTTYIESIQNGVTTLIDHHSGPNSVTGSLFTIAEAAKEIGMRTSLCYEVSDRDGEDIVLKEIKENINFIKRIQKDDDGDMIKGLFGLHASFTLTNKTLYRVKEAMEGIYDGYHIHIAEGIEDQYDSLKKYGRRVIERLYDFGILGERTIAVHGVHINHREIEILKETNTNVVHNPESNMNNAVGAPPVVAMIKQGIRVGLGTDAYTNDMFESMKVANILQSHQLCDPTFGFNETQIMQFKNNPEILKKYFKRDLGVLKKGAYADIITVDYEPWTPINKDNWFGHVLFGMTGRLVNDTIINGKFIMKNRKFLSVDVKEVYAKSRERAKKIWTLM